MKDYKQHEDNNPAEERFETRRTVVGFGGRWVLSYFSGSRNSHWSLYPLDFGEDIAAHGVSSHRIK